MPFITERWWLQFFLVRVFERTNGKEIVDTSFDPCQNHVLHTSQKNNSRLVMTGTIHNILQIKSNQ